MRLRGSLATLLLFLTLLLPWTSASQPSGLYTGESLVLVPGELLSGNMTVVNNAGLNLSVVVYTGYSINGSLNLSLSLGYTIFNNWKTGESQVVPYRIRVPADASPGRYVLSLRFRAMAENGSILSLVLTVPVVVKKNPVELRKLSGYVLQRPNSKNPFNGETLLLTAEVVNLNAYPEGISYNLSVMKNGSLVLSVGGSKVIEPGLHALSFRIPVGWNWSPGAYRAILNVSSFRGSEVRVFPFYVSEGVGIVNFSLSSQTVLLGAGLKGYLTVGAERDLDLNVTYSVISGSVVFRRSFRIHVSPGTEILEIAMPTNVSGSALVNASLEYDGVTIATASASYTVMGYPSIANVSFSLEGGRVRMEVSLRNPNSVPFPVSLYYAVTSGNVTLVSDSKELTLQPGVSLESFSFVLPKNRTYGVSVYLSGTEGVFDTWNGSLFVPPAGPPVTSTSPTSPTNTTGGGGGGEGSLALIVGVIIVIAVVIGVFLFSGGKEEPVNPWERARKPRSRPKPKRRSPLGRFKRPKLPKFVENRELPKRRK
ncbi:hypothetical protein [Thermococcus sp.]